MKKELLLSFVVVLGFSALAPGAAFQILDTRAAVSSSGRSQDTRLDDSFSESAIAPDGFTAFDVSLDVPGSARQSTTIDLDGNSASIDSSGGASVGSGYFGSATSSFTLDLEIFEPTAYSVGGSAFRGLAGDGSVTFKLIRDGREFELFRNFPGRPARTGTLGPGIYELRGSAFGSAARSGSGGGSYDLTFRLGAAAVPEATESLCFLAGSVMIVFAGTRRRSRS